MIKIEPEISFKLEKAVKFLVEEYGRTGNNPKPVVLHSLRMAIYLLEAGCSYETAAAAILHDLLEDAGVSLERIKSEFGERIAEIVGAVSFDPKIDDPQKNYQEMFDRAKTCGREALLVKAADLLNNSCYYGLASADKQQSLWGKVEYFLTLTQEEIGNEPVWLDLKKQLEMSNS
ncbi:MAG: HD domain-containing protein [Patescibacteria group bacterium]|jgi:(p)ppGpp synthase/HD superfamily hydrolase